MSNKIVAVNASPRRDWNTDMLLCETVCSLGAGLALVELSTKEKA